MPIDGWHCENAFFLPKKPNFRQTLNSSKSLRKKIFLQSLPINYKFKYQSIDAIVKMTFFFGLTNPISSKHLNSSNSLRKKVFQQTLPINYKFS